MYCDSDKHLVYPKELWHLNLKGDMVVDGNIYDASEYCIEGEEGGDPWLLLCSKEADDFDYEELVRMLFMCLTLGSIAIIIFFHIIIEELRTNRFTKLKIPLYLYLFISFLIIVITTQHGRQKEPLNGI